MLKFWIFKIGPFCLDRPNTNLIFYQVLIIEDTSLYGTRYTVNKSDYLSEKNDPKHAKAELCQAQIEPA